MLITIDPLQKIPSAATPLKRCALLDFGFRIFFLLGACSALLLVLAWVAVYTIGVNLQTHFDLFQWHAHEMLFGFAVAIIAGFLLTAPANWTGLPMPTGVPLASLALLWLLGRVVLFLPGLLPGWLIAFVDVAFLPVLASAVAKVVWQARQKHNAVFPVVLLVMTAANVLSHFRLRTESGLAIGTELMLYLVLLMISLVGGRVIPGFTWARLPGVACNIHPRLEKLAAVSLISLAAADLGGAPAPWMAGLSLVAAGLHGARWWGWHVRAVWSVPLLWILYVAYAWIIAGLLLKAAFALELVPLPLFRHAFTVGGIGTIILGMMCRVTMGHTGRPMVLLPGALSAFALINVAAVVRALFPLVAPAQYRIWIDVAGASWAIAFLIFLIQYGPLLWRPRADGRPG